MDGIHGAQRMAFQNTDAQLDDVRRQVDDIGITHVKGHAPLGVSVFLPGQMPFSQPTIQGTVSCSRSSRMAAAKPAPLVDKRKAGRFQDGD